MKTAPYHKLEGLPPVHILTLSQAEKRRTLLNKELKSYNIKDYFYYYGVHGLRFSEINKHLTNDSYTHPFSSAEIACSISHLRMIKNWYDNSEDEHAIFFEDDICLSTVNLWRGTWDSFFNKIDFDFDILQLSMSEKISDVLVPRKHYYYSAAAYLLKRESAKKIINKYFVGDLIRLNSRVEDTRADYIIYSDQLAYSVSMFVSRCEDSYIHPEHLPYQKDWKDATLEFLKSIDRHGI
jgi:hypothetical protein